MDRDGAQMGLDVADTLGRRTSVHLGGTLMRLGREPMALGGGEMRRARAGMGFVRAQYGAVDIS